MKIWVLYDPGDIPEDDPEIYGFFTSDDKARAVFDELQGEAQPYFKDRVNSLQIRDFDVDKRLERESL